MDYLKAIHLVFVVCWFGGLFYLPRLFVYHTLTEDKAGDERFKVMERRLYRGIMLPSALGTLLLGIWLATPNWSYYSNSAWFWIKMVFVMLLYAYHGACGSMLRDFANGENTRTDTFYRWFNEFPVIILLIIVIMAVVKPSF